MSIGINCMKRQSLPINMGETINTEEKRTLILPRQRRGKIAGIREGQPEELKGTVIPQPENEEGRHQAF